jgi:succinyl-diaminopimelate desuccinylase
MVDVIMLASQLIGLRTDAGRHDELRAALDLIARQLPADVTVEWFVRNGHHSFLAYAGASRPERFRVILNGHVDVIPGKPQQYQATRVDDRIYGVGALDMKSNLAVLCAVFADMVHRVPYPLALQVVSDEEIGGFDGTLLQVEQGVRADFVISGETTQFNVVHQAKGIVWLKVHAQGVPAHGAYPWRGQNALSMLTEAWQRIATAFPVPTHEAWVTTVNLARIETSNVAFNKVPDEAHMWLDVRCVPADAHTVVARIREYVGATCRVEVIANEPALDVPATHPDIVRLQAAVASVRGAPAPLSAAMGSSDARHFTHVGCAGVEFGPVGGGIGSDEEWTSVVGLTDYAAIMRHFLGEVR